MLAPSDFGMILLGNILQRGARGVFFFFFIAAPDVKRSLVLVMNEIAFPGIIHAHTAHAGGEMCVAVDLSSLGWECVI